MGLIYRIINFVVFFLIIILLPGLPPKTTFPFKEFSVSPVKELKGALELNNHLDGGERLLEGRLYGPECLIARKQEIYTGIHGGEIIKLTADHVTHVAKFGQPCEDIYEEQRCGRPLGLAFDTVGNNLFVADAYNGIWEVDLSHGRKKLIVSPQQELDGKVKRKAKVFNSIAVDRVGNIYWTDSSSDYVLEDILYSVLSNPSGRLFYYDRLKNTSEALMDELFFPNGVALSPNEDFVVVAETGTSRLYKYYLKGAKKGTHEVFVDGLPGSPDNLTPDEEGIWIPLIASRDNEHPSVFSVFSQFPNIRLFIVRLLNVFETFVRFINNAFPNKLAQKLLHYTGHGEVALPLFPKRSTVVRIDWNGNILGSLHGFDKSVGHVSHVLELGEHLYLGSPYNRYLARVRSPKSPQVKIRNVRYEGAGIETVLSSSATPHSTTGKLRATASTLKPATITTTTQKPITTSRRKETSTTPVPRSNKLIETQTIKTTITPITEKSSSSTTAKPKAELPPVKRPAPITEKIHGDTKPPKVDKLKVIKKGGEHTEF